VCCRSEGQSDRRDNDRKRRDGRGRSPPRPLPSPSPAPIRRRRRGEDTDDEQDDEDARLARHDDDRMDTVEEEEERASVANDVANDVGSEVRSTSSPRRDDASPRRPHSPSSEARDTQVKHTHTCLSVLVCVHVPLSTDAWVFKNWD
jgi:hypothetical protein